MEFNVDLLGIKCNIKVDQQFVDNVKNVGTSLQNYLHEYIPDISHDNLEWSSEEESNLNKELQDGFDMNKISKIHKRSVLNINTKIHDILIYQLNEIPVPKIKIMYNNHPNVLCILSEIVKKM